MRFLGMFRFTVGETIRKGTLIFYFAVATLILIFFALSIGHVPDNPDIVTIFGTPILQKSQMSFNAIEFLLLQLHSASVFWIILFGIFGIAGLIPRMLDKGTIDLFLSKPLSRTELLSARALGAVTGVSINLLYFFLGIWFIFGLKLGVWHWGFLSSVLYVIYAFICFFSVVAIVGLITRSTGITIMLAFVFALLSGVLESREKYLFLIWDNVIYRKILDTFYYITPQLSAMLTNSSRLIGKSPFALNAPDFTFTPFVYSFFSTAFLYLLSIWYFSRRDY